MYLQAFDRSVVKHDYTVLFFFFLTAAKGITGTDISVGRFLLPGENNHQA